jgi:hypothetical protein
VIVRTAGDALWLVTQPDHAGLAAALMEAWCEEGLPARPTRAAALYATAHHDIGWAAFDAAPSVDPETGRPVDFISAPPAVKQAVWRHALQILPPHSTYAAALVAQHAISILRRYRADPGWHAFFDDMDRDRDHWFAAAGRSEAAGEAGIDPPAALRQSFLQDYAVVGIGDTLSLTFCNGWTSPQAAEGYGIQLAGTELRVCPDPFDGRCVTLRVAARRVPDRRYESDDDLRATWRGARAETLEGTAVGVEALDAGPAISTP